SRASQARYWGLGGATVSASTFDMDFELLPQRVEITVELRRIARRQRRRPPAVHGSKADRVVGLHPPGPAREHDHPLRHAHGLAYNVSAEERGFLSAPQYDGNSAGQRQPRL